MQPLALPFEPHRNLAPDATIADRPADASNVDQVFYRCQDTLTLSVKNFGVKDFHSRFWISELSCGPLAENRSLGNTKSIQSMFDNNDTSDETPAGGSGRPDRPFSPLRRGTAGSH
jgi:hypothetical protein